MDLKMTVWLAILIFFLVLIAHGLQDSHRRTKRIKRLEEQKQQKHTEWLSAAAEAKSDLEKHRTTLVGTGKMPFIEWESNFLESHQIKFRTPNIPRAKPSGWNLDWDKDQLAKQSACCFWCGSPLDGRAHRDHVVPLAGGGENNVSNLVMSCPECNLEKSAQHPNKWLTSTDRITHDRKVHLASLLISLGVKPSISYSNVRGQRQILNVLVEPETVEFEITQKSEETDLRLFE